VIGASFGALRASSLAWVVSRARGRVAGAAIPFLSCGGSPRAAAGRTTPVSDALAPPRRADNTIDERPEVSGSGDWGPGSGDVPGARGPRLADRRRGPFCLTPFALNGASLVVFTLCCPASGAYVGRDPFPAILPASFVFSSFNTCVSSPRDAEKSVGLQPPVFRELLGLGWVAAVLGPLGRGGAGQCWVSGLVWMDQGPAWLGMPAASW
jgi:hypothetical protein